MKNPENILFQIQRLKAEGKEVGALGQKQERVEKILYQSAEKRADKKLKLQRDVREWDEELTPTEKKVQKIHEEHYGE